MKRPLKIVIAGYVVGFPVGGMIWSFLTHMLGFSRLGHEVLLLEDSGDWCYPFDPYTGYSTDSSYGRAYMTEIFSRFGLEKRWAYYSKFEDRLYGWDRPDLDRYLREADLFFNMSGVIPLREEYLQAKVNCFIDTDPVFTQVKGAVNDTVADYYRAHDIHYTYGYNLPDASGPVPLLGLDWKPVLPPVLLNEWAPVPTPGRAYTTVGSWDAKDRDVVLGGTRYAWRKSVQYDKIIDLPAHVPGRVRFELAYSGMERAEARYLAHGWGVRDGMLLSRDVWGYRDYIRDSRGEFTVAKDQNILLKSGWFSERAACYLAAGRPVITQDCGASRYLPVGHGLLTFENEQDILAAVEAVESDYECHRRAARRIAEEHFDACLVLGRMLKEMGLA